MSPPKRLFLRDEEHIKLVLSTPAAVVFECFLSREATVAEAVQFKEGRIPRAKMMYWLRKMLAAGLVEQVGVRPGAGKDAAVYRSVADEYIVSGALAHAYATSDEGMAGMEKKIFGYVQTAVSAKMQRLGDALLLRTYRANEGFATTDLITTAELEGKPSPLKITDNWFRVRLPRQVAKELEAELEAIYRRLQELAVDADDESHPFYVGHVALVEDTD